MAVLHAIECTVISFATRSFINFKIFLTISNHACSCSITISSGPVCYNVSLNGQIKLSQTGISEYVIRTQPDEASLSTLESVAYALSWLEASPSLYDKLVQPMRMLCQYQLKHGAVVHHSKEYIHYKCRQLVIPHCS